MQFALPGVAQVRRPQTIAAIADLASTASARPHRRAPGRTLLVPPAVRTREERTGDVGSDDAEDLRDEDEGVAAPDTGLRDAAVAVAELGGDGQQEA